MGTLGGHVAPGAFFFLQFSWYLTDEALHVRCRSDEALDRAKSLVNLQFSWYLTGTVAFVVVFYLQMVRLYQEQPQYVQLVEGGSGGGRFGFGIGEAHEDDEGDLEAVKGGLGVGHVVSGTKPIEIER